MDEHNVVTDSQADMKILNCIKARMCLKTQVDFNLYKISIFMSDIKYIT